MKKVLILLLLFALLLPLVSCDKTNGGEETTEPVTTATPEPPEETELKCTVRTVGFDGPVSTLTDLQTAYYDDKAENVIKYAEGMDELSRPVPVTLRWDVDFEAGEKCLRYFVVRIWTKNDQSDARAFIVDRSEREYRFFNSYIGQKYFWDVTAYGVNGVTVASRTNSFTTEDRSVRFLYVDGVTNFRDLGGKKTVDGGRVRQGLLIRGAKLNDNGSPDPLITEEGVKTMVQTLGIKSELDLRKDDEVGPHEGSFLGDGVEQIVCSLRGGIDITNSTVRSSLKKIFAVLADENNYPIYFHCAAGADRTGIVGWLVNGLCGVSEDDLWRDYLTTNFGNIGGSREKNGNGGAKKNYVNTLSAASGSTNAKKVYNYLKNEVGIPADHLDAVIRIMKITPGTTEKNTMPLIPAGHTHAPESDYTVIKAATCSSAGIRVKYCSVCGEYIESTVAEIPVDPNGHQVDWTVIRQPTVPDQADGSRNGTCAYCGKQVEQTLTFAPTTLTFTDKSSGSYKSAPYNVVEAMQGKHFYPTANDPTGNDLYIEYSVFYHRSMQFFDPECNPYATTRLGVESVLFWSPVADIPSSWCQYAGGFEATGDNFMNAVSDSEVTTPAKIAEEGGTFADYPNIGGPAQAAPQYGWHRIGLRIHQKLTNIAALKKDTVAGATQATYVLTLTVYIDGAVAYKLKTDDSASCMRTKYDLLFIAASDGKGGIVYTDIGANRFVIPFHLNATTAKSGKYVYTAIADVFVTCGKGFVQSVEKLATPTESTVAFSAGVKLSAPVYYRIKD